MSTNNIRFIIMATKINKDKEVVVVNILKAELRQLQRILRKPQSHILRKNKILLGWYLNLGLDTDMTPIRNINTVNT